ncbi:TnsA endonuclease N-terminal domain-containing protein [Wohlfahrtiimonas chitiniclastica]|uniref:TnsA endonuclease N-terminal domain-containing protein n=1 Tax=Wohlfahrtiimonas chitiniclastica TaxID=400946 RepID=UPI001BCDB9BF|nr:TnsA endonuclease N-terminal domain-containing protein [Wohlfahrtiimonas chitiniclastica]MBS7821452.1 TnsA endonuclease N-terminal domain-containing protein [Wohlfahrtiimonas chitiniclastica]
MPNFLQQTHPQRVRNPITPSRMTVRGQFPSQKMKRMIAWESQLERRACYQFEFSENILTFREQPITLLIPFQGIVKKYTPDFEIITRTQRRYIFEIKPFKNLQELKPFFLATSDYLARENTHFAILTEKELISPILEKNLLILRSYQRSSLSNQDYNLFQSLASHGLLEYSFLDLKQYFSGISAIYTLITQGLLSVNLYNEINDDTQLKLINEGIINENFSFTYRAAPHF